MMSHWPLSFLVNFIILRVELTRLYVFVMYSFVLWMSISVYFFVMHIFVWVTFHIIIDFRHAHLCTNDYPYSFGFSSCTSLYGWLSIFFWIFVIHISVEWLSIFFWIFVMHISERMTIHILLYFRHAHHFTNDYPYYSCMGFRHAHFCTNDYPYTYWFSSCTSFYEWLTI